MNDHQIEAKRLREKIEEGRRSGKPKTAAEVLDRLERSTPRWPERWRGFHAGMTDRRRPGLAERLA